MTAAFPLRPSADYSSGDVMACPDCGEAYTHVDTVLVSAREEDGPFNEIAVDAVSGKVETHRSSAAPGEQRRRHRITLVGYCEQGHRFAFVFGQHKGVTFVDHVPFAPSPGPYASGPTVWAGEQG